ncbi:hypothetical protein OAI06_03795, partial [Schleiferiaceae bacterium]|nr:hypothetical protein [Schleiferiaceae bacterium]
VFLLGSGPSVKSLDLERLNMENCIFLNNFIEHPGFEKLAASSRFSDTEMYYLIAPIHPPQTKEIWLEWLAKIDEKVPDNFIVVLGINAKKMNIRRLVESHGLFKGKQVHYYFAGNYSQRVSRSNIDMCGNVLGSETVSLYAIYAALHIGYKDIGLIGMDHSYLLYTNTADMRMFAHAKHQQGQEKLAFARENMYKEYFRQYKVFKKYSELDELFPDRITNYTEGGLLNVFKRKSLDEVL